MFTVAQALTHNFSDQQKEQHFFGVEGQYSVIVKTSDVRQIPAPLSLAVEMINYSNLST